MATGRFIPISLQLDTRSTQIALQQLTGQFNGLGKSAKSGLGQIETEEKKAERSLNSLERFAVNAGKAFLDKVAPDASRAFQNIRREAAQTGSSVLSALSSSVGGVSGLLGTVAGGFGGTLVLNALGGLASGLKNVVTAGIDFNATVESAQISLKHLLGSSDAAKTEIEKLKKEALAAPVDFTTLLELDQRMISVGFNAKTTAHDLTAFSQGLGLIAGTKGLDDRLERVTTQLVQMATKGRAANEELTILAENNIPVYKILAEATGKTSEEIFKLAEGGRLKGLETADLLFKEIGKSAKDAAPEISNSFAVLSSNVNDLFQQTSGKATENIFGSVKKGLQGITGEGAQGFAQSLASSVNGFVEPLTNGFNSLIDSVQSGKFFSIGSQVVSGIGDGIKQAAKGAWDKAGELGQGILDTLKGVLDIQSPSKKTKELGQFAADGFTEGLIDRTSEGFKKWAKQIEKIGGEEFIAAVERVAKKIKANPNDLLGVFAFESGLNPQRQNSIGATGLIQFTKPTAKGLGTSTQDLKGQTAVEQLQYVEAYLTQFGKVLDTTEKLYSSVLRGKVISDKDTVLFTDKGGKTNKDPYFANKGLDKDKSGTISLAEATSQITKQGFTTPGKAGGTLKDTIPVLNEVKAQVEPLKVAFAQVATSIDPLPVKIGTMATANVAASKTATTLAAETGKVATETNKAAQQAENLKKILRDPLADKIRDLKNEIAEIGQNLESKGVVAQLEAIKEIRKADEDAYTSMIKNRARLEDATVYHAGQANASVLEFLAKQKTITETFADFRINTIKTVFDGLDSGIDKATAGLGKAGDAVRGLIKDLVRLGATKLFEKLFGVNQQAGPQLGFAGANRGGGGGGFNPLSLLTGGGGGNGGGSFLTPGFAGGNPAQAALGGGSGGGSGGSGGGSGGGIFNSILGGNRQQGGGGFSGLLGKIPGLGKLFGGSADSAGSPALSGLGPNIGGLPGVAQFGQLPLRGPGVGEFAASGLSKAAAAPGAFASLGAGGLLAGGGLLGSLAGGSSSTGKLLGGLGGTLGLGALGATGIFGSGVAAALPALFSNPITAIVAGGLIGGALLFKFFADRTFNKFRKEVKGAYQIEVDKKEAGRGLFKGVEEIGKRDVGKDWKNKIPEVIQLKSVKDQIAQYGLATNQTNSPLVQKYKAKTELTDPNDDRNNFIKREFGGPIVPGAATLVGERRPEIAVFGQSGEIFPSIAQFERQLIAALQQRAAAGGFFSSGFNAIANQLTARASGGGAGGGQASLSGGGGNDMMMAVLSELAAGVQNLQSFKPGDVVGRGLAANPEAASAALERSARAGSSSFKTVQRLVIA